MIDKEWKPSNAFDVLNFDACICSSCKKNDLDYKDCETFLNALDGDFSKWRKSEEKGIYCLKFKGE